MIKVLTMITNLMQRIAGALAGSILFRRGRNLFKENSANWNLPLTKFDKLWVGAWLILDDYSKGVFPPDFPDQQKAYQAEKDYRFSIPGMSAEQVARCGMTKPFWFGAQGRKYISHFNHLTASLERTGVKPPAKILELGCGHGWMAEFLATMATKFAARQFPGMTSQMRFAA